MKYLAMNRLLIAALPMLAAPALAQVTIDAPKSGWRNSAGAGEQYTQAVNYPAASVSLQDGQAGTAMIKGKIAGTAKGKPATLVVNGVAMPLSVGEDGSFGRPYAFGRGSNSVEVRAPGGARARTQFVDAYASKTQARLRVVLSWDSDGTDIDLHVVTPDGQHSWYGNRVIANGGALDVDVTTGFGPEIFSSPAPARGNYHVYVNYFGSGASDQVITMAQVAIISNENTPNEKQQVFKVPLRGAGDLMLVKSFVYP